ncbi:MAG: GNAT family N-acetyltransferase [Tenericutes bacterium]|nr:GNAT family N-acetyltransferase [Mycoplasmatota bacterium]
MEVIIRNMRISDIPKITKYDLIMLGETLGEDLIKKHIENSDLMKYFVMETKEEKRFIGQVSLWIDEDKAQINNFYIVKDFQGQKFGHKFMDFIIEYFKSINIREVTLEVRRLNQIAINLYQSYGFITIVNRNNYYPSGENALLMYLRIGSD